ncbi:MAG: hypothetical protein J6T04_08635 [Bacteroidales bacterium]|nr:hypothetical protein [Bacteroidales bacterium]
MAKYKFKQIGTFEDYCKSRKSRLIKENSEVAINVPFWDDAVQFALNDLRNLAGGETPLNWDRLVDKIKKKFALLNIFDKEFFSDDSFIKAHVKDILYNNYAADGFLSGDTGYADSYSSEELGAKALILSKLADTVLQTLRVEAGLDKEPEPENTKPVATVSLETGLNDDYDDLPFEYHNVADFGYFVSLLRESVDRLTLQDDDRAFDYCLNEIEADAGSLKLDDVLKVVKEEEFPNLRSYLESMVDRYLLDATIELNGKKLKDKGEEKHVLKQAKKLYAHEIVQKLTEKIKKETL